jgi:hypothetical protein
MSMTEYRAMCAELVDDLEMSDWPSKLKQTFRADIARARALLAQPVAEGPTDQEIEEWADACPEAPLEEMDPEVHGWRRCFTAKEFSETIRAALDRWGRSTPQPVAVSKRLPEPEDCDEQGRCWLFDDQLGLPSWTLIRVQGESLAPDMYWLPANALPTPEATNE